MPLFLKKLKIGVAGIGHLGKIHLKCLQETPFDVVGYYDPDDKIDISHLVENISIIKYASLSDMLEDVDCVDIVCPTKYHFDVAYQCLIAGKHIFIEKPVTETTSQANILEKLAADNGLKIQVGHVERYNPVFQSLQGQSLEPKFLEVHRLAIYNPRGTDVSVVLDLMIHDIDLIFSLVKSPVVDIQATGMAILSSSMDIVNARLTFENKAVANITASRISMKNMRKFRFFQSDAYVSLDLLDKEAQIIKAEPIDQAQDASAAGMTIQTDNGIKRISIIQPEVLSNNAIVDELNDFYQAIMHHKNVTVSIQDAVRALDCAIQIESIANRSYD